MWLRRAVRSAILPKEVDRSLWREEAVAFDEQIDAAIRDETAPQRGVWLTAHKPTSERAVAGGTHACGVRRVVIEKVGMRAATRLIIWPTIKSLARLHVELVETRAVRAGRAFDATHDDSADDSRRR